MRVKYYSIIEQLIRKDEQDAGFDIKADLSEYMERMVTIQPHSSAIIPTGLYTEIDPGYYGKVSSRSGLAFKSNLEVHQGTIDAGYRGEWKIKMYNLGNMPISIQHEDRIAQVVFLELPVVQTLKMNSFEELEVSERGTKGFGSSGKK